MTRLDTLREQMLDCQSCDLCKSRTNVVFGEGNDEAKIILIGEAPGQEEDKKGVPFIGAAGAKLDKILEYVGVTRSDIYIANSVLCRPPNNRNPNSDELMACRWRLQSQIDIIQPDLIVLLGKVATQQLQGKPIKGALKQYFAENLGDPKGWLTYKSASGHVSKVIITYHPSYLLRSPVRGYREVLPHWTKVRNWLHEQRQKA